MATNNALSVHARVTFLTLDKTAGIMFLHESNQSRKLEAAVMGACVWMLVTDKKNTPQIGISIEEMRMVVV